MKILIIDDEIVIINLLKALLLKLFSKWPKEAVIQDALSISKARIILEKGFVPDVVFSDYNIGSEFGTSIFPLLREKNPKVFICLMSGRGEEPEHTANVYVHKSDLRKHLDHILFEVVYKPEA
jgi:two-component SAPR family response regulator